MSDSNEVVKPAPSTATSESRQIMWNEIERYETGYCNNEENDSDTAVVCERYALEQEIDLLRSRISAAVEEHDASGDAGRMLAALWPPESKADYDRS